MLSGLDALPPRDADSEEEDECDNDVISRKEEVDFCGKRARSTALKMGNRIGFAVLARIVAPESVPESLKGVSRDALAITEVSPVEQTMTIRSLGYPARLTEHARRRVQGILEVAGRHGSMPEE